MGTKVRFYLDENVQIAIAAQLHRRGIEVVTVRDLNQLGDEDFSHLERATQLGYVLCTHDPDYVEIATAGFNHSGIILGQPDKHTIGDWVRFLELVHGVYDAEDIRNLVEYVD